MKQTDSDCSLVQDSMRAMRRRLLQVCSLGALTCSLPSFAHEYYARQFMLIHPWTDPTTPGQANAHVHFRLESIVGADRLLAARFAFCRSVELRPGLDDALPALAGVDIVPGERMDFVPDGAHVMLKELTQPLLADRSYPLELVFEISGTLVVMMSMAGSD